MTDLTRDRTVCQECGAKLESPEEWPPICASCRRDINRDDQRADHGHLGGDDGYDDY